jgi:hypothetical protein
MSALQSIAFLFCLVACVGCGVAIFPARRMDRAEAHLLHKPGTCHECEDQS